MSTGLRSTLWRGHSRGHRSSVHARQSCRERAQTQAEGWRNYRNITFVLDFHFDIFPCGRRYGRQMATYVQALIQTTTTTTPGGARAAPGHSTLSYRQSAGRRAGRQTDKRTGTGMQQGSKSRSGTGGGEGECQFCLFCFGDRVRSSGFPDASKPSPSPHPDPGPGPSPESSPGTRTFGQDMKCASGFKKCRTYR